MTIAYARTARTYSQSLLHCVGRFSRGGSVGLAGVPSTRGVVDRFITPLFIAFGRPVHVRVALGVVLVLVLSRFRPFSWRPLGRSRALVHQLKPLLCGWLSLSEQQPNGGEGEGFSLLAPARAVLVPRTLFVQYTRDNPDPEQLEQGAVCLSRPLPPRDRSGG